MDVIEVDMAADLDVSRSGARVYLARDDERVPVGFLHVSADRNRWVIEHIYVDPAARRQGVARALLARAGRVAHDNRMSTAGAAAAHTLGIPVIDGALPREDIDDAVAEDTGRHMLALAATRPPGRGLHTVGPA